MAWTSHGHQIAGSTVDTPAPTNRARCGGPGMCPQCGNEAARYTDNYGPTAGFEPEILPGDNDTDYLAKAKRILEKYVDNLYDKNRPMAPGLPAYEIYVVWFCKTLKDWKALLSTTMEDGMYYELTYNGEKHETYLDAYKKRENICIPD